MQVQLGLDRDKLFKLAWVSVFAAAMAFVEAAVVVYLRLLYYPHGFAIENATSVDPMSPFALRVEIGREAATILMLASLAFLVARKSWWERFAYFVWAFGVWDVLYYLWLNAVIGWPPNLMAMDILFLIPFPWIAPVVLPIAVSGLMMVAALAVLRRT